MGEYHLYILQSIDDSELFKPYQTRFDLNLLPQPKATKEPSPYPAGRPESLLFTFTNTDKLVGVRVRGSKVGGGISSPYFSVIFNDFFGLVGSIANCLEPVDVIPPC